jgi:hypothetical protein
MMRSNLLTDSNHANAYPDAAVLLLQLHDRVAGRGGGAYGFDKNHNLKGTACL